MKHFVNGWYHLIADKIEEQYFKTSNEEEMDDSFIKLNKRVIY